MSTLHSLYSLGKFLKAQEHPFTVLALWKGDGVYGGYFTFCFFRVDILVLYLSSGIFTVMSCLWIVASCSGEGA